MATITDHSVESSFADSRVARFLEEVYARYHHPRLRGMDPIDAVVGWRDIADREIVGLVAAVLAYGNVKSILRGIDDVMRRVGPRPRVFLLETPDAKLVREFRSFRYRVTSGRRMAGLLVGLKRVIERHGGINECFATRLESRCATIVDALGGFVDECCDGAGTDLPHLLPHPDRGSACKRSMLYLRWMVRSDAIDPGGWTGVRPARLIIPLDTHMHRMALRLGLTRRRQADLRTAIEITQAFARIQPDDPLRYDFALTRPGILREAPPEHEQPDDTVG